MESKISFKAVDSLISENIKAEEIELLKKSGIFTLITIRRETRKKFASVTGLSIEKVDKIKKAADKLCAFSELVSSDKVCDNAVFIATGVAQFDCLLNGGLKSKKKITEVFGKSTTAQFLLSHTLCVTSQIIGDSQIDAKTAFLDCSETYSVSSVECIAQNYSLDVQRIIGNITHVSVTDIEKFNEIIESLPRMLYDARGIYNLVVVNSFSFLFGDKKSNKQCVELLHKLHKLSEDFNFAIFLTNEKVVTSSVKLPTEACVRIKLSESEFGWKAVSQNDCSETYFAANDFGISQLQL